MNEWMLLLLLLLALVASFFLLHRITDRFFIPSLDGIARKKGWSSDVAGSTLMAVGSSAPELAVAVIAIFRPGNHEAIGIGTIVGSSLFNALFIVGFSIYIASRRIRAWSPILRDLLFYLIASAILIVTFIDGHVSLLEAVIMLLVYMVYVMIMKYWKGWFKFVDHEQPVKGTSTEPVPAGGNWYSYTLAFFSRNQFVAFLFSIGGITALSWVLVDSAIRIAEILHVSEAFIALTVLAVGTSVPDFFSSKIVAKQGRPGMAVNNAIGSNIFDILIGLGLPLFILNLFTTKRVTVDNSELLDSFILLISSILVLFLISRARKNYPRKMVGLGLVLIYVAYLAYETVVSI